MNSKKAIKNLIQNKEYEGILDQDGWETLELTVRNNHSKKVADLVIEELQNKKANRKLQGNR